MVEETKRLENIVKKCDNCKLHECINCEISYTDVQAIKHLIKSYKELEEENRIFAMQGSNVRLKLYIDQNYILKSLVKEKIEELKKEYEIALEENSTKAFILKCQLEILNEILEEGRNENV